MANPIIKDKPILFDRRKVFKYCKANNINLIKAGYRENMSTVEEDIFFSKILDYNIPPEYVTETLKEWYENWLMIDEDHRIDTMLFFDTETTTLDGYSCSISLITLDLNTLQIIPEYSMYAEYNPNEEIHEEAFKVHGLSQEYLKDKPTFDTDYEKICKIINHSELKNAFNAIYDIGVLNRDFKRIKKDKLNNFYFLDPMRRLKSTINAKDSANKLKYPSLEECCKFYNIPKDENKFHNAQFDTEMLVKVFIAAIKK